MEIELLPEAFSNLVDYFDFESLQEESGTKITPRLPPDFFRDYLEEHPKAFSELPEPLRRRLTEGLQLESVLNESGARPQAEQRNPHLIIRPGVQQPEAPSVQAGGRQAPDGLILPEAQRPTPEGFQRRGELDVPKTSAWQILYKRWNELDLDTQRAAVRWEYLSRPKRAVLAIEYAQGSIELKENLPDEDARLFQKLSWSKDGATMEFRHREDIKISDPNEFLQDVLHLARRAGVERRISNPEDSRIRSVSFHYHVSVEDKDLTQRARALNRLIFIRRVHLGILNDLTQDGKYLYDPSAAERGLIRIIDSDRFEVRSHHQPLPEELAFHLRILSLDDETAMREVESESKRLMNEYVVEKIAEHRVPLLAEIEPLMTPEQRTRVQPKLELSRWMASVQEGRLPPDFWVRAPHLIRTENDQTRLAIAGTLERQPQWTEEVWAAIPHLMRSTNAFVQAAVADAIDAQPSWPAEIWAELPDLMKSPHASVRGRAFHALGRRPSLPQEVWKEISQLMKSGNEQVRDRIVNSLLFTKSDWPLETWAALPYIARSRNTTVRHAFAKLLEAQPQWPPEFWAEVPRLMASEREDVQYVICKALVTQRHWPPEVWAAVPHLMTSETASYKYLISDALKRRSSWPREFWVRVPDLMKSQDSSAQARIAEALLDQRQWPPEVWAEVPRLMQSPDTHVQSMIAAALSNQTHWPPEVWAAVPRLMTSREVVQSRIARALKAQPRWPPEVWAAVPGLMKSRNETVQHQTAEALGEQSSWPREVWAEVPALEGADNEYVREAMDRARAGKGILAAPGENTSVQAQSGSSCLKALLERGI